MKKIYLHCPDFEPLHFRIIGIFVFSLTTANLLGNCGQEFLSHSYFLRLSFYDT